MKVKQPLWMTVPNGMYATATPRLNEIVLYSMMIPYAWVYIMANKNNTTLYVGVSTDLNTRVWEHKTKVNSLSFSSRYNIDKLVYFEGFDQISKAVQREKFIKGKSREWKEALINKVNPNWNDLSEDLLRIS